MTVIDIDGPDKRRGTSPAPAPAAQWHWLYVRGVSDFDDMTNVSKDLRAC
jgi:hypothetical protein